MSDLIQRLGDPAAEYDALRTGAALAHATWIAALELTGKDRVDWLQGLFSNDLKRLSAGQSCYGVHLTVKGKMVADLTVLARADSLVLITEESTRKPLVESLDRYLIREEVEIHDHVATWDDLNVAGPDTPDDAWTTLWLRGPRAHAALEATFGAAPALPPDAFATLGGAVCVRVAQGYDLHLPRRDAPALAARLAPHAAPVGPDSLEVARVEDGTPRIGADMDENTIPLEAGLEARAISYTKGCYVGQEVIARIHSQGHVNRVLVGLLLDGDALPARGTKLRTPERELGWVTSAVHSRALHRPIALAFVRRDHAQPGTRLSADAIGAEVHALPFLPLPK